jgi:hypothetical protein
MLTPVHRSVAFGALFWGALEAHHAIQQSDEHGIIIKPRAQQPPSSEHMCW